ncbi:MAG TPA: GntR family transcriptional regulator [Usitatibacter sp.]|nr:GntR family transcriptional regulator [Usitatibacter sp.]
MEDPLYKHVKSRLVAALRQGDWKPGEALPSEAKLAEHFEVGISTIRAAVGELSSAGLVVRRQGKGTYVAVHDERSVYRFFNVVRDGGEKELPASELVSLRKATADDETADLLRLPRSSRRSAVWKIRNVLRIGDTPVVVSDIVVPSQIFPGITTKMLREEGRTLYAVFQKRFGVTIVRITEKLKAARADATAVEHLGMRSGEPVLELRRVAYSFDRRPVEIRRSQIDTRSNHYRFEQGDAV